MPTLLESAERRVLATLSVLITCNTLLFIAPQSASLTLFRSGFSNDIFYFGFAVLAVLTLGAVAYYNKHVAWSEWKQILGSILVAWFPGCLVLVYGFVESNNFHYIFKVALGVYVILTGILLCALAIQKERVSENENRATDSLAPKEWIRRQGLPTLLFVLFTTGLFFSFGLYRLTEFAAVDEPLWSETRGRIQKYWKNIGERDWKGTNISDKPGITVALIDGPSLLFINPKEYATVRFEGEIYRSKSSMETLYFALRFPILLFATLILPLFYFFLERLVGRRHALFGYVFIALSPILVGMSKIINPDSLLWLFAPLSLLSYLVFLERRFFRYLFLSGILLGLALLTKYVANILFVFFVGLVFLDFIYHPQRATTPFADHLKRSLKHLGMLTFSALTTFYVLFPAVWIKPEKLFTSTLFSQAFEKVAPLFIVLIAIILLDQWFNGSRVTEIILRSLEKIKWALAVLIGLIFIGSAAFVTIDVWAKMVPYDFMDLLAAPKTIGGRSDFVGIFLTNFYPLIFGVTPLVWLFLFLAPTFFLKKGFSDSTALRVGFYLVLFILLYYLGATVNNVASITRYQIILFPMAAIVAGLAFEHVLSILHRKYALRNLPTPVLAGTAAALLGALSLLLTPFPLSYASSLLPAKYHTDVKDMGAGSYEAAQYLNSLPDAKNLLVWTDKDGVCKFFVGRCKRGLNYSALRRDGLDYIIVSAGRRSRTPKVMASHIVQNRPGLIRFDQYYDREDAEHTITINGRPSQYVKIFKFEE